MALWNIIVHIQVGPEARAVEGNVVPTPTDTEYRGPWACGGSGGMHGGHMLQPKENFEQDIVRYFIDWYFIWIQKPRGMWAFAV